MSTPQHDQQLKSFVGRVVGNVETAIVGKTSVVHMVVATVLANGHILFEDFPGLGKTMLARTLALSLGLEFRRIQFTPDLLPGDITGGTVFNRLCKRYRLLTHRLAGSRIKKR